MTGDGEAAGRSGCIAIGVAFTVLLVLLGALSVSVLLGLWSDEPPASPPQGAENRLSASAAPPCTQEIMAFKGFARSRSDVQTAVLDAVTLVCWQPSGELRVEARYPADINASSASMRWLCATLAEFAASADRAARGFTVYSTHAATQGRAFLVGNVQDRACTNPQHSQ